jgi:hypothetical protein
MCTQPGLEAIDRHLSSLGQEQLDALRGKLRIGVHRDVEVTDVTHSYRPRVSQAFCSALPVTYSGVPPGCWRTFATFILEAAYEATLLATVESAQKGGSNIVLLTMLGGGAFGNDPAWIIAAIRRALGGVSAYGLDVRLVAYGPAPAELEDVAREFG